MKEEDDKDGISGEEASEEVLDEGCYYLSRLGLGDEEIAARFEIAREEVGRRVRRFGELVKSGEAVESASDLAFWSSVKEEAEGNIRVTFVSERGFHHSWRSELRKLDGPTLLSIYESCKRFLDLDPNSRFLEYDAPKNYDPIAMTREVNKALGVISALLDEKWGEEEEKKKKNKTEGRNSGPRDPQ